MHTARIASASPCRDFLVPRISLFSCLLLACSVSLALESLDDSAMSDINGAGIVYGLDDFSFRFAPTSFIEMIGVAPAAGSQAESYGWKRGDARFYGLSFTYGGPCTPGTGPGTGADCGSPTTSTGLDWYGNTNTSLAAGNLLAYPMGKKNSPGSTNPYGIVGFASVYNPFILRVFQNPGYDYNGVYRDQVSGANAMPTVVEFIGPSKTDPWRWAFWGELEVNRGGACPAGGNTNYCGLQSQTIINGTPTTSGQFWNGTAYTAAPAQRKPAILRLMQTTDTTAGAPAGNMTLGINYQSALSGDFRFSVQQTGTGGSQASPVSPDSLHTVPSFNTQEGLYFKNVDAYMPLGILHSQALMASGSSAYNADGVLQTSFQQNGNFVLELTRIPDTANVYNYIYCGQTNGSVCVNRTGGTGAAGNPYTYAATTWDTNADGYIDNPNNDARSYIRWGNWTTAVGGTTALDPTPSNPTCNASNTTPTCFTAKPGMTPGAGAFEIPTPTSTANGIYFKDGAGNVTNIGISRIEGMVIQHLKISSLGGGS